MKPRVSPTSPSPTICFPRPVSQALNTTRSAGIVRLYTSSKSRNPSRDLPSTSTKDSTSPDNSGCVLSNRPCVAKCTIRYWLRSLLRAVSRLASKSNASIPFPGFVVAIMASASWREKDSRGRAKSALRVSTPTSSSERVSWSGNNGILLVSEAYTTACLVFAAFPTRESYLSKRGSARTATSLGAAPRPFACRRSNARTDADGRFTFFFQAEDGIRDLIVTGVQTCALPICAHLRGVAHVRAQELCRPAGT